MPEQLFIAIFLLCLLFILEYILAQASGNPFSSLKIIGHVLHFQKSVLSKQISVSRGNIDTVILSPGHIELILDSAYQHRILSLNFDGKYTDELYGFLRKELTTCSFELHRQIDTSSRKAKKTHN